MGIESTEGQPHTWSKTMDFRWNEITLWTFKRNGDRGQDMAGTKKVLQQAETCDQNGEVRWVDVPVIKDRDEYQKRKKEIQAQQQPVAN